MNKTKRCAHTNSSTPTQSNRFSIVNKYTNLLCKISVCVCAHIVCIIQCVWQILVAHANSNCNSFFFRANTHIVVFIFGEPTNLLVLCDSKHNNHYVRFRALNEITSEKRFEHSYFPSRLFHSHSLSIGYWIKIHRTSMFIFTFYFTIFDVWAQWNSDFVA